MNVSMLRLKAIISALPNTISNGQTADAVPLMADLNHIVNQVNANAQQVGLAALLAAANTFTMVQSGVAATQAANFPVATQVQNSAFLTLSSTLGTNAISARVATLPLSAYATNQIFSFFPSQTNTAAATLAIDGLAAAPILANGIPLSGGEIRNLSPVSVEYDGTNFNLLNAGPTFSQVQNSALTSLTSTLGTNTITARQLKLPLTAYAGSQVFTFIPSQTNTGAATINIDGLGAKNIMAMGSSAIGRELVVGLPVAVQYDGTQFNLMTRQPGKVLLAVLTASNSASLTFTGLSSAYDKYEFEMENIVPVSNGAIFSAQVGLGSLNGSTYQSQLTGLQGSTTAFASYTTGTTEIWIAGNVGSTAGRNLSGLFTLHNPSATGTYKMTTTYACAVDSGGNTQGLVGTGAWLGGTGALDRVTFAFSSLNIASGAIYVFGIRKN